jgi:Rieske 2Fe-2S family protein
MDVPTYQPGPYSQVQESGVRQFVEWYTSRMQAGLAAAQFSQVA